MTTGLAVGQANALLDALCRSVTYSDPAAFYIKLHTGDPGVAGTANAAANTTRQACTFAAAASGACATSGATTWTNVSNTETYAYVSFWSAVTSGTFLGSDSLVAARAVTAGDTFNIPAGDVSLSLSPIAA